MVALAMGPNRLPALNCGRKLFVLFEEQMSVVYTFQEVYFTILCDDKWGGGKSVELVNPNMTFAWSVRDPGARRSRTFYLLLTPPPIFSCTGIFYNTTRRG